MNSMNKNLARFFLKSITHLNLNKIWHKLLYLKVWVIKKWINELNGVETVMSDLLTFLMDFLDKKEEMSDQISSLNPPNEGKVKIR